MRQFYNNFEHPTNTKLMTFLVDQNVKAEFQRACRSMGTNMTAEINKFMRDYITKTKVDIEKNSDIYGNPLDSFFSADEFE